MISLYHIKIDYPLTISNYIKWGLNSVPQILNDIEIKRLIDEIKILPPDFFRKVKPVIKSHNFKQHSEYNYDVLGENGTNYVLIYRQCLNDVLDFSVGLGYRKPDLSRPFLLKRYNGFHEHTNTLENETFEKFHIHTATERYQQSGFKEEHFAEESSLYSNARDALTCLLRDCHFQSTTLSLSRWGV